MVKNCDVGREKASRSIFKLSVIVFHHTGLPAGKYHIHIYIHLGLKSFDNGVESLTRNFCQSKSNTQFNHMQFPNALHACIQTQAIFSTTNISPKISSGRWHIIILTTWWKEDNIASSVHLIRIPAFPKFEVEWFAFRNFIRDLQIWVRVRDRVRKRLFNSSFQASHYHNTYPFHPMSFMYPLYLKPTWTTTRPLETSLFWNSKVALVLNLVLVVQSEGP